MARILSRGLIASAPLFRALTNHASHQAAAKTLYPINSLRTSISSIHYKVEEIKKSLNLAEQTNKILKNSLDKTEFRLSLAKQYEAHEEELKKLSEQKANLLRQKKENSDLIHAVKESLTGSYLDLEPESPVKHRINLAAFEELLEKFPTKTPSSSVSYDIGNTLIRFGDTSTPEEREALWIAAFDRKVQDPVTSSKKEYKSESEITESAKFFLENLKNLAETAQPSQNCFLDKEIGSLYEATKQLYTTLEQHSPELQQTNLRALTNHKQLKLLKDSLDGLQEYCQAQTMRPHKEDPREKIIATANKIEELEKEISLIEEERNLFISPIDKYEAHEAVSRVLQGLIDKPEKTPEELRSLDMISKELGIHFPEKVSNSLAQVTAEQVSKDKEKGKEIEGRQA